MAATQTVEETEYDVTNVSWVSSVASASYILASNPESGLDSVEDFVQNDDTIQIGLTGTGGTSDLVTILSIDTLNTNAERITGFEGESEAISAVVRGEVDARFNNISSIWPRIEDGDVTGVVALMDELPEYAAGSGIPLITDFDEYASIADFASVHFPIGAPPETDDERVEILEQAIGDAVASEEMAEWSDQNELPLRYSNAAETEETVTSAMETLEGFSDILEEQL
jgi:tripartite-type tricarboxylate transporter receptor subunit TctC